jgi:integrase/recombinase XerD
MTPLRKRMMEELQLRNLSPITADTYIRAIERFAKYFRKSPAEMGPEQVREYLLHLLGEKKVVASTILVNRAALKFIYVATLKQKWFDERSPGPNADPRCPASQAPMRLPAFSITPGI